MSFYLLPFICLGIYAAVKYLLLPTLERMQSVSASKQILKQVAVSSVHTINSFVLLAAILYAALGILFVTARLLAGAGSVGFVGNMLHLFDSVNKALSFITDKPYYSFLGFSVLFVAFCAALYRNYKIQYSKQFDQKAAALAEGFHQGTIPYTELPPTSDMQAIQERLQQYSDYLNYLREEYKQNPSPELAQKLKDGEELVGIYSQAWYQFDIFRRVQLDTVTPDRQSSLKDDVFSFLVSRGFVDTVTSLTGTLSKVTLACTLVSLITIQTLQGSRLMADQLGETYLTKKLEEARSSFEETVSRSAAPRTVTKEDEIVLDEMASDYELLFANSLFEKSPADEAATFRVRSLVVRQQILDAFVKLAANRSNNPDFGTQPDIADSSYYDITIPEERTAWRAVQTYTRLESASASLERAFETSRRQTTAEPVRPVGETIRRKPKTATGEAFKARMRRDFATQSDILWTQAKKNFAAYKASFHETIPLHDLRGRLFTEAIGKIIEPDFKLVQNETIDKIINDLVGEAQGELIKKANDKLTYEFMDMMAKGEAYEDIVRRFNDLTPSETFGGNHRAATMRSSVPKLPAGLADAIADHHPPSLKPNARPVNATAAEEALKNLGGGTLNERTTAALNSYEDFFPGQIGSDSRTSAGKLRASLLSGTDTPEQLLIASADEYIPAGGGGGGGIGTGGGGGGGRSMSRSRASFVRSRSYIRLRGFSRIGGVLIGKEPDNSHATAKETGADFVNLSWHETGGNLTIYLRNRDSSVVRVGTYPKAIVQQALAYAADGRLTTVTMVTVPPVAQLKVLLHPSLVNSQLGLTAMDLDRLVDTFQSPEIERARERVQVWGELYRTAYLERTLAAFPAVSQDVDKQKYIDQLRQAQQARWTALEGAWPELRSVMPADQPDQYPFREKAAYFDLDLLDGIQQAMRNTTTFQVFKQAVIASFSAEAENGQERDPFGSEFEVWSGVREQKYSVDKELSFLQNKRLNPYYPLDFMVQVAFTSVTNPNGLTAETDEEPTDNNPWQFPTLANRNAVNDAVMRGVAQNQKYSPVLGDMQQFTQLQRVFRLAFRGQLGYDFPLDELLNLLRSTNGSVPRVNTPEWNLNPNAYMADMSRSRNNADLAQLIQALGVYRREEENN